MGISTGDDSGVTGAGTLGRLMGCESAVGTGCAVGAGVGAFWIAGVGVMGVFCTGSDLISSFFG